MISMKKRKEVCGVGPGPLFFIRWQAYAAKQTVLNKPPITMAEKTFLRK